MSRYDGYECPVCKGIFEDGDDIVTCPECGTPHHRECYNLVGKCVNHGLHKSGYTFVTEQKKEEAKEEKKQMPIVGEYYSPNEKQNADNADKKQDSSEPQIFGMGFDIDAIEKKFGNENETIDGNDISDVAATIRTNIPRFITRFRDMEKNNKKVGWNWGAFFLGSLYFLFRKMYKQGISLLCVFTAIVIGSDTLMYKYAPQYVEAIRDMAMQYADGKQIDPSAIMTSDYQTAAKIVYITLAIIFVVRVFSALFADYFYKSTVAEIIDKMNKQLSENMSFSVSPLMGMDNQLTQEQMKKMYLARRGGVSIFAPAMAILIVQTLLQLL